MHQKQSASLILLVLRSYKGFTDSKETERIRQLCLNPVIKVVVSALLKLILRRFGSGNVLGDTIGKRISDPADCLPQVRKPGAQRSAEDILIRADNELPDATMCVTVVWTSAQTCKHVIFLKVTYVQLVLPFSYLSLHASHRFHWHHMRHHA